MIREQFGRWTVISPADPPPGRASYKGKWWLCRCRCGVEKPVMQMTLRSGQSRSCGCLSREKASAYCKSAKRTHGHNQRGSRTKEYSAWCNMLRRCYTASSARYACYGGRGIKVCDRWRGSFNAFLADVGLAPSTRHSLGRVDNDGNYEPGNVEWQTSTAQLRNTSFNRRLTLDGCTMTLGDWAAKTGIRRQTIQMRIDRYGWSVERALSTAAK